MRTAPCWLLAGLLVACGSDTAPTPAPRGHDAPAHRQSVAPAVGETVAATPTTAPRPAPDDVAADAVVREATRIVADAAVAAPAQQAKAPAALRALGVAALPALTTALRAENVAARRIAALTLLQWSDDLHRDGDDAVIAALAAAREDADPAVRAAAEHAFRRATGDTSALDQSRAADEAAQRTSR